MAKQELGSPFLTSLGISIQQQSLPPTVDTYPSSFNPKCLDQWKEAVSKCYRPVKQASQSAELWGITIGKFFDLCSVNNVFPFLQSPEQINRGIIEKLVSLRSSCLETLTTIGPRLTNVQTNSIQIDVSFIGTGFVISASVEGYFEGQNKEDPTIFAKIARQNGFQKAGNYYTKSIAEGATVVLGSGKNCKCRVGYKLSIPSLPCIPSEVPSRQELVHFILDIIYKPLLKINPTQFCSYL